ncbi:hypothetical protein AYJ08_00700 [Brevibacillus sp. SKDU10]|uniref:hypothetical protein n=1 Tax=Brevibacillus sp. SKDU10 TaxID=1247872 RepID=UPI0007C896EF|nr:hypothetical protein [Brevibacillus sp. SKDU10]OAJ73831.1 hypothetical protein AYJ08_00700 [Brevibacillus sp. SKDU10]
MNMESIINGLWDDKWDISTDPNRDLEAITFLLENDEIVFSRFPTDIYTLDRHPFQILDNEKFEQSNIFYEKSLTEKNLMDVYKKEEEKFIRVFQILWSNSPVYIETMLPYNDIESVINVFSEDEKINRTHDIHNKLSSRNENLFEVQDFLDLQVLLELGLREQVSSVFIFVAMKLCIWSNYDLNMPVYSGNKANTELLRLICTTEGLYSR